MWILGNGSSVRAFRLLEEMAAEWFSTERKMAPTEASVAVMNRAW